MSLVNLSFDVKEVSVVTATQIHKMTNLDYIWCAHSWKGRFAQLAKLRVFLAATLRRLGAQDLLLGACKVSHPFVASGV